MSLRVWNALGALAAGALSLELAFAPPANAAYSMCAFRAGPQGPCTCKSDTDGPGQFTTVNKSRCKRDAVPAPGDVNAGTPPADATPPATTPAAQDGPAAAPAPAPAGTAAPAVAPAPQATAAAPPTPVPVPSTSIPRKLDEVRARGKLLCGVNTSLLGFSAKTSAGNWAGLDADFCRAVAASVFGDAGKVEFVPVETAARFEALQSGKIDLLARNTTWTMARDVELGLEFAGVLYFDGQGFLTGDEKGLVSAQQLSGSKVCVEQGTTSETNMAYYFKAQQIDAETKSFATHDELVKAYINGACDAYSGDRSALYSDRAGFAEPLKHSILPEVISKEPLGPAVLQGDTEWTEIVRWTLAGLINAEEAGLNKASAASAQPLTGDALRLADGAGNAGEKLRIGKNWLRDAVAAAGNYGEMFEANVGAASPIGMNRGINALWKKGGILYAPPMW